MHDIDHIALEGSIHEMRLRLAKEQSAMHKVRLAVARWRGTPPTQAMQTQQEGTPCKASCTPLPCQSRWQAQTQCDFMCWLEAGGFAQAEAPENATVANTPADESSPDSTCLHCPT
ncbi:hypothetical protein ACL9RI_02505 [Janthinobacterium sp. Mn2066]|uniref:hypothetical protein n=1 Tax=Janthinobacterium sp. Mn2066 TaxID=3395264 RepID=UPI003BD2F04D